MSFQAYIDNVTTKTGQSPEQIKLAAEKNGIIKDDMNAREFCDWLVADYKLGHGHCMALWNLFIRNGWIETKHTKLNKKA